jgi:hypothetical protein
MQSSFLKVTSGPIFALTFYALALVSEICASTSAADPQSAEQEEAEKQRWIMHSGTTTMHSVAAICLP